MGQRWTITGQVQGVTYRQSLCREAARLSLAGWVRNRIDGSVEAQVQGPPSAVIELLEWARRGPPRARVAGVACADAPDEALTDFAKRPTA